MQKQSAARAGSGVPPGHGTLIRQASQAMAQHQFAQALELFEQVLENEPGSVMALAGAGHALLKSNRHNEAVRYLIKASRRLQKMPFRDELVVPMLQLAQDLEAANRVRDALPLLQAVLRRHRRSAQAYHLRAACLLRLGEVKAASVASVKACELAPGESNAVILNASIEARQGKLDSARSKLSAIAADTADANRARAMIELARVEEKLGNFDAAFDAAEKSGEIMLVSAEAQYALKQPVRPAIKHVEQVVTQDWLHKRCHRPADTHKFLPVFLIGFYRSGTTLLEQILATHNKVFTSEEADLLPYTLRLLDQMVPQGEYLIDKIERLDAAQVSELRHCYFDYASESLQPWSGEEILLDKTTLNTLHLGLINVLFPDAKIIFAIRDPRDVCISCLMEPFALTPLTVNTLGLEQTAELYADIVGHWLIMRNRLTLPWLEIRYEDVVENMKAMISPVFEFMGLEWTSDAERFYIHARNRNIATPSFDQVRQPLYRSSIGRWRNYRSQLDKVAAALEPYIKTFGYSQR